MSSYPNSDDETDVHYFFKMFTGTVQDQLKARLDSAQRSYEWCLRDKPWPEGMLLTLSLSGLPIFELPPIPEWVTKLDISDTRITELDCATLPPGLLVLEADRTRLVSIRNLHTLDDLRELSLDYSCWLERIEGPIPLSLRSLSLRSCISLTDLPSLGRAYIWWVNLQGCEKLRSLPGLPVNLATLQLDRSGIKELPFLPDSLRQITLQNGESGEVSASDVFTATLRESQRTALRKQRFDAIHEELMAAAWHPKRVEAWLTHGEDTLDMMMGC
jgi:hypothetical protein